MRGGQNTGNGTAVFQNQSEQWELNINSVEDSWYSDSKNRIKLHDKHNCNDNNN